MGVEAKSRSPRRLSKAGPSHIKAIADGVNEADLAAWLRGHSSGTENSELVKGANSPPGRVQRYECWATAGV